MADFGLDSGFGETQGRRDTMEDAHVVFDDILQVEDIGITTVPGKRVSFYGVYDGHGGVDTAKMVQSDLHKNIVATSQFKEGDIEGALKAGFAQTDDEIVKKSNADGWMNGSTGVVAILVDNKLYIANVGDSEACVVSTVNGEVTTENLTTPHKASEPSEKARVEELGGHVFWGRVFGALAVSRSFGDSKFKQPKTSQNFVSCEPALHTVEIRAEHEFLILACDGLWDVMNHTQAAQFAKGKIAEGESAKGVAAALVSEALRRKTEDNVTAIVVIFNRGAVTSAASETSEKKEEATPEAAAAPETPVISQESTSPAPTEDPAQQ